MASMDTSAFPIESTNDYYAELVLFTQSQDSGAPKTTSRLLSDMDTNGKLLYEHVQHPFDLSVDLKSVAMNNRSIAAGRQLAFPDKLYQALAGAHSCIRGIEVPEVGSATFSVDFSYQKQYVCLEENNHVLPFVNHIGTTMDLRLINELTLERFRDAVSKHFPKLTKGMQSWDVKAAWVKAKGDIRGVARLAWWVDDFGCVALSAAMPGTDQQVSIHVVSQNLLPGVYSTESHAGMALTVASRR